MKVGIAIIGAGVIVPAIAARLSVRHKDIFVVEKIKNSLKKSAAGTAK